MTHKPTTGQQAAARLLQALDAADDLSCEQAQARLPAFVEAERAGEDVDTAPEYAALLRHLDRCDDCMELYTELVEDLEALAGEADALPQARATPPTFFAPSRETENVVLRVLRGLKRHFEFTLPVPRLAPQIATLGGGQRRTLFADTLAEIPGEPFASLSLSGEPEAAELLVAVREASAGTRWQVQLFAGDTVQTATTDERGIARFGGLAVEGLQNITVSCVEIAD